MKKSVKARIAALGLLPVCMAALSAQPAPVPEKCDAPARYTSVLEDTISKLVSDYPGEIGVSVIIDGTDTVAVNDRAVYPLMSVFKLHQAVALCHDFDRRGLSLDSVLTVSRATLDPDTWSPMLKEHPEAEISLTVEDLLRYALVQSDNNASNIMFGRFTDVAYTDSVIATIAPRQSFQITCSEAEMAADHAKAYANRTSPTGAAILIDRLFTDSLVSREKQDVIIGMLRECKTGGDRISAPLQGIDGVTVAHKTGTGYIDDNGVLVACNDVAHITLPDNTGYTLAVFVKDFKGDGPRAAEAIAAVSDAVVSVLSRRDARR